jgi:hypothetical protein
MARTVVFLVVTILMCSTANATWILKRYNSIREEGQTTTRVTDAVSEYKTATACLRERRQIVEREASALRDLPGYRVRGGGGSSIYATDHNGGEHVLIYTCIEE